MRDTEKSKSNNSPAKGVAAATVLSLATLSACGSTRTIHVDEAYVQPNGSISINLAEGSLPDDVRLTADTVIDADGNRWNFHSVPNDEPSPILVEKAILALMGQSRYAQFDGISGVFEKETSEPETDLNSSGLPAIPKD